jgi:AraC family transcriptional regulator
VNRITALRVTPLIAISRFDHAPGEVHTDPPEESVPVFGVSFVEHGRFDVVAGRERRTLDRQSVFVTPPGFTFRCIHHEELPDDVCVSVDFEADFAGEVVRGAPAARPERAPVVPLTNRLGFLRLQLLGAATHACDVMAAETLAGELLAAALGPAGGAALFGAGQLAWYTRRVLRARERMDDGAPEPLTLAVLAREAGMSPWHFARVFRELAGTPPHRYLRGVRLRRAAALLAEGASVTHACHASGFQNLGHFSRSFRRAFGTPPSRYPVQP